MGMRRTATACLLVLACGIGVTRWSPPGASAQAGIPRVIDIDKLTCAELLASPSDRMDGILIYFDGFVNGMGNRTIWDERVEGEVINRVVAECKASPASLLLSVFTRAARR
jgi:HdeA/HdeB family